MPHQLKTKYQAQLQSLYGLEGVEFPDSIFWFIEFLLGLSIEERDDFWSSLCNVEPVGPLYYLLELAQGVALDRIIAEYSDNHSGNITWDSWWIDNQFYDDPPEFLTCLQGEIAGEHWGLLLDDPALGFRGVAMFYNADGSGIGVHQSILAAIVDRFEEIIDSDNEDGFIESAELWLPQFDRFITENGLNLDDSRPVGIESDTGLSIIPSDRINKEQNDRAVKLLIEGRSLWFWSENTFAKNQAKLERAYELMKTAYELMDRSKMVEILDVVYDSKIYMLNNWLGNSD
jgi:hypothetical protein